MKLFEQFINKRSGRIIWLILIIASVCIIKNEILASILAGGLSWFAITYSLKKHPSKHSRLWQIFAIIVPLISFIVYIVYLEQQLIEQPAKKESTFILKLLKLLTLFVSVLYVVIVFVINQSILSQSDLSKLFLKNFEKLGSNEKTIDALKDRIDTSIIKNNRLFQDVIDMHQKQLNISRQSEAILLSLRNNAFMNAFPEYRNQLNDQMIRARIYAGKTSTDTEWYKEAAKERPNDSRLSSLLNNSNQQAIQLIAASKKVEENSQQDFSVKKVVFSHMWSIILFVVLVLLGLILMASSIWSFVNSIKRKEVFQADLWLVVFIACFLVLIQLLLTLA